MQHATPSSRRLNALFLSLALALGACSGSQEGPVRYDGDTLIVMGTVYRREPPPYEGFVPGHILVQPLAGQQDKVEALLDRWDLEIARRNGEESPIYVVEVPAGFEAQWSDALSRQQAEGVLWTGLE